jgi:hypothetical protein
MQYVLSKHCKDQMKLRGIHENQIFQILNEPEQSIKENDCTTIYQSVIKSENAKKYLFRIFVNTCIQPNIVITVYRTSKIVKYHEDKI